MDQVKTNEIQERIQTLEATAMREISPERQLRVYQFLTCVCAATTLSFFVVAMTPSTSKTLTVQTLKIVDEKGVPRLLLSAALPNPKVGGKEYPRSTVATGLQFNDASGNEMGGLAMFEHLHGGALCFDYQTAEALCVTQVGDLGFVGLTMLDKPVKGSPVGKPGPERIVLAIKEGVPQLTLNDQSARARVRLQVDTDGTPKTELLDAAGKPVLTPK